ncbi:MAG: hypothetical protein Kow0069_19890 [Promethearchaeota archaeon]
MSGRDLFEVLFESCEEAGILGVIVGGYALPAYGVFRTTVDRDFCIRVKDQEQLDRFVAVLREKGIYTTQNPRVGHLLFFVQGKLGEAEIWLSPIGDLEWDEEMVKRVLTFRGEFKVLSVEDFVAAKLGREGRSTTDLKDVIQILVSNAESVDLVYLRFRLEKSGLWEDFVQLVNAREVKERLLSAAPRLAELVDGE